MGVGDLLVSETTLFVGLQRAQTTEEGRGVWSVCP